MKLGFQKAATVLTTIHVLTLGDVDAFRNMMSKGFVKVNTELDGTYPVHEVCKLGYAHFLKVLLEEGADTTLKNCMKETGADLAMRYGQLDCLILLQEAGVELESSLRLYSEIPTVQKRDKVYRFLKVRVLPEFFWKETKGLTFVHSQGRLKVPKNIERLICQYLA